jgi:hypothetical protein
VVVYIGLFHQQASNRCKIEHENAQRWILIYVWCFFLLLASFVLCKLMGRHVVSLRLQTPLCEMLHLHLWWWLLFFIIIFIFASVSSSYASGSVLQVSLDSVSSSHWSHGAEYVLTGTNFTNDRFYCTVSQTLVDCESPQLPLVKIPSHMPFISQVKFFVVITVNLFDSKP